MIGDVPVPPGPAVVVTGGSLELRRTLGVLAWAVLVDVTLDAAIDDAGRLVAATNVRRIAERLGISKDSAAAALTRLRAEGLVMHQPAGREARGRFDRSTYLIHLHDRHDLIYLVSGQPPTQSATADGRKAPRVDGGGGSYPATSLAMGSIRRRSVPPAKRAEQPALFDLEGGSA